MSVCTHRRGISLQDTNTSACTKTKQKNNLSHALHVPDMLMSIIFLCFSSYSHFVPVVSFQWFWVLVQLHAKYITKQMHRQFSTGQPFVDPLNKK